MRILLLMYVTRMAAVEVKNRGRRPNLFTKNENRMDQNIPQRVRRALIKVCVPSAVYPIESRINVR
jgi:hypothetical protein